MPGEPRPVYWDACVLLSYINEVTERVSVIDELLRQSRAGEVRLLTSALSQVEVAFAASEKEQAGSRAADRGTVDSGFADHAGRVL